MGGWDDDDGMTSGEFWSDYSWIIWVVIGAVILVLIITNIVILFVTMLINLLGRCLAHCTQGGCRPTVCKKVHLLDLRL